MESASEKAWIFMPFFYGKRQISVKGEGSL